MAYVTHNAIACKPIGMYIIDRHKNRNLEALCLQNLSLIHLFYSHELTIGRSHDNIFLPFALIVPIGTPEEIKRQTHKSKSAY